MEVHMRIRAVAPIAAILVSAVLSSCSNGRASSPLAPSGATDSAQTAAVTSSLANLQITSVDVSDSGQNALGRWRYNVTVSLHDTTGVDVIVTNIDVQAFAGSTLIGTASIAPMLLIPANSSRDTVVVLASSMHVLVSAVTPYVTVTFRDKNGNTGSVSSTSPCYGCWDY
jgi:hypothetical protein